MAHKKGQGSTKNGRDSNSQRLGVKLFGGQLANAGSIIIRQRGTHFKAGKNAGRGTDDTIYSLVPGTVNFHQVRKGSIVSVIPAAANN